MKKLKVFGIIVDYTRHPKMANTSLNQNNLVQSVGMESPYLCGVHCNDLVKNALGVVLLTKEDFRIQAQPCKNEYEVGVCKNDDKSIKYKPAGVCKVPPPLKLQPATEWDGSQIVASWSATPLIIFDEDQQLEHDNRWEAEQYRNNRNLGGMYGDGDYSYLREKWEY